MNISIYKTHSLELETFNSLCQEVQPVFTEFSIKGQDLSVIQRKFTKKPDQHLMVVRKKGLAIGFCSFYTTQRQELSVLHLAGTVISKEFRSQGLYKSLIRTAILHTNANVLVTCSQNPRVYETLKQFVSGITPGETVKGMDSTKISEILLEHCERTSFDEGIPGLLRNYYDVKNIIGDSYKTRYETSQDIFKNLGATDAIVMGGIIK